MKSKINTFTFSHLCGIIALSVVFGSCAALMGLGNEQPNYPNIPVDPGIGDGGVRFTILQLNDVYEIAPLEKGTVGGMARVATLRNQLLIENYNMTTVLAGDFLSPSLIGTLKTEDGKRIRGKQMVEVMNALGVSYVAFGNHEFDIKEEELQERMNESYFEWIGTNVLHQKGARIEPFFKESYGFKYHSPETSVWEIYSPMGESVKIGIYSATINSNPQPWVYYEDPYQEATKAYLELSGKADVIVGLTHLSLEQDLKLAALLPKTALIMGGHEHENHIDTVGNVIIAKADANAKTVYVHRFTYFPESKSLQLESELVPINDEIYPEPTVDSIVQVWQSILKKQVSQLVSDPDEVIYNAKEPLDGLESSVRNKQTNLGGIIAASMAFAAKKPVDCAFFNGGSIRIDDKLEGEVTTLDIFRAMPFGGGISEVEMKGTLLKKCLNAGLENAGVGGYLQWHNIEFDSASKTWKIGGKLLSEGKVYRVMTNDFLLTGKESRLEFFTKDHKDIVKVESAKEGDANDLRADVRKAVVAYLKQKKS